MKKIILLFLITGFTFSQNNSGYKAVLFSLTPKNKIINQVDGLAIGLGLDVFNEGSIKKVNGLNLEVNPIAVLYLMFANPTNFTKEPNAIINGLHFSTGNIQNIKVNGLSVSFLNIGHAANGSSINLMYSHATKLNGLHISGLSNSSESSTGMFVSFFNSSNYCNGLQIGLSNYGEYLEGVQLGLINKSEKSIGVQIGLFNFSKIQKGLQIGFWNVNNKRSMPFINW
jgi:hypothetical protein